MEKGYIKLWRAINDNELLSHDKTAFYIFVKLLLLVDRKTGSYTTGRKVLSVRLKVNEKTLYSALKRLNESGMLQQRSSNQATTFYICNWSRYQQDVSTSSETKQKPISTKQEVEIEKEVIHTSSSNELRPLHEDICKIFGKSPERYTLTPKRQKMLKVRMKDTGEQNILKACRALAHSDWHMGANDRGWIAEPYWSLTSVEKAEEWSQKFEQSTTDLSDFKIPEEEV